MINGKTKNGYCRYEATLNPHIANSNPQKKNEDMKDEGEFTVDLRNFSEEDRKVWIRDVKLVFQINHTIPYTEEYNKLVEELFEGRIGENSQLLPPFNCISAAGVTIGKNVVIMGNCLMMARGGITIGDGTIISANVQLLSNGHDLRQRNLLLCKPINIGKNVWIGAGVTIMPGVSIGDNAVVEAGAVVTRDLPDNVVVAGVPATLVDGIR